MRIKKLHGLKFEFIENCQHATNRSIMWDEYPSWTKQIPKLDKLNKNEFWCISTAPKDDANEVVIYGENHLYLTLFYKW